MQLKDEQIYLIAAAGIVAILAGKLFLKKTGNKHNFGSEMARNIQKYGVWDKISGERINTLHPDLREQVRTIINNLSKKAIFVRVTSGYRSLSDQRELYDSGRINNKPKVTNAAPGYSYHNYGLAVDVVPMVAGRPVWNNNELWKRIAAEFRKFGYTWGGDFRSFKDKPHFQKDFGKTAIYFHNFLDANGKYPNLKKAIV